MSYCRWSDGDLYVYENMEGFITIHVAELRRDFPKNFPKNPVGLLLRGVYSSKEFLEYYKQWRKRVEALPLVKIGLPYDGRSWGMEHRQAADWIKTLRSIGYNAPEGVEKAIMEDFEEN